MATSEWLQEMRRAAISKPRDAAGVPTASTAPSQAVQAEAMATGSPSAGTAQTASQGATERVRRSFTAPTDPARDYRAMYAALFRFHERHNPPTMGDDDGALYWQTTNDDMIATAQQFDDDPFMLNLLYAVFNELEMEYKRIRGGQKIE